jgi:hypothetical protein
MKQQPALKATVEWDVDIALIYHKSVTTQNLAFLSYWYRKKRFNRYSVITQFAKFAAGEQLGRRCTHRKL